MAAGIHVPGTVLLDDLEDRYLPVPFDHRGHARMADMTGGCTVCHHYSPADQPFPACRACHEAAPHAESLRKPGLKGAYHRQCLNCHREWSHETQCSICHLPRTDKSSSGESNHVPTKDDIVGRMHPPIPEPETEIFQGLGATAPGSQVIFRHREHVHRFGLTCVECHHETSCNRCHDGAAEASVRSRTLEEHHQPCQKCHEVKNETACGRCHWREGEIRPPPFDHGQTGWPLGVYHASLSCRVCHATVPFTKRDRGCVGCHDSWTPATFNHAVTGQMLDERHAKADCGECHVHKNYAVPPACDACHDEDEGITFPAKRPGAQLPAKGRSSIDVQRGDP